MKKFVFAIATVLLFAGFVLAVGYGRHMLVPFNWDSKKVLELKGEVSNISAPPMMYKFKAEGKEYVLHLGPAWLLDEKGIKLQVGSKMKVKGMVVNVNGINHLFASQVEWGNLKLQLRDDKGYPVWSGRGKGRGRGCKGMKSRSMNPIRKQAS